MNLVLLRSFVAVAESGTITDAAERLRVTQPALSRRIHQLEEFFGVPLFHRSRKGIALTPAGEMVVPEAVILIDRFDNLRAEVTAHAQLEGGTVRIGGGATAVSYVLPGAIAAYQSDYPAVRFEVKEAGSREISTNVVNGQLELGVVTLSGSSSDLDIHPLVEDAIVPICGRSHPLSRAKQLDTSRLTGQGLVGFEAGSAIRQLIDNALHQAGIEMNVVMELRSIPGIVRMVATTGNLAFVSRIGLENDSSVRILHVQGLEIRRQLAVVMRRGAPLSPAAARFAERLLHPGTDDGTANAR